MTLTEYTGPCDIRVANTVIDAKIVRCNLGILAMNVHIKNSLILGSIDSASGNVAHSLLLEDSEVDGGTDQIVTVANQYFTLRRANIHGGEGSVGCAFECDIQDSWLHDQYLPPGGDWHLDGFISNGGRPDGTDSNVLLRHNTIVCEDQNASPGYGCSGNVGLFPDFAPLVGFTIDRNLFVSTWGTSRGGGSYCLYAGAGPDAKPFASQTSHIVITNNTFQRGVQHKCAQYGPTANYDSARVGNVWSGNLWDDGTSLTP